MRNSTLNNGAFNGVHYSIGFTVDNTQVRKGATICFFTGVNAPYTPLTTLPSAGGQGASSLSLWIISAAAAGFALLVCAGVVSVKRRSAAV